MYYVHSLLICSTLYHTYYSIYGKDVYYFHNVDTRDENF